MMPPRKVVPQTALVQPRVVSPRTGEVLLLADVVREFVDGAEPRLIEVIGPRGSGKSTALAHLATLPWAGAVEFWDDVINALPLERSRDRLVVYATRVSQSPDAISYRMAKWSDDDLAEYVLAIAPDRCRSVLPRVLVDPLRTEFYPWPQLCRAILDEFLRDDALCDMRVALSCALAHRGIDSPEYQSFAYGRVFNPISYDRRKVVKVPADAVWLDAPLVARSLAADYVADALRTSRNIDPPTVTLESEDMEEIVRRVQADPDLAPKLRSSLTNTRTNWLPFAASIYHAIDRSWHPPNGSELAGAILPEAQWSKSHLERVKLDHANLAGGDFANATLDECHLAHVEALNLNLNGATLVECHFCAARLSQANLAHCVIRHAFFFRTSFSGACFDRATLHKGWFTDSDLRDASFKHASLNQCRFHQVQWNGADFTGAKMDAPQFRGLCFRGVRFEDAELLSAKFEDCHLEYVVWSGVRAPRAEFTRTAFTGSRWIKADLAGACLQGALMADICWEDADLRGADLSHCVFHMGSSRSGLVGSPYPSHGTRTGFYTDDYDDQTHKAPEEICKASLRGANLKGAIVKDADFYLVDLRDAQYDAAQRQHFQRCGAIL